MKDLIVVATLTAKPGHEAALQAALEKIVAPSRAEAGCARYELHADIGQAGRFVMLETWRDQQALTAHEATPHFQTLLQEVAGKAEVQVLKLDKLL
ncbi:antibiotic biosynthesis monooxygenase [Duganella sp. Leaf126]|uniref:putative quinol monooxygenase n=1 Tax=Duganella sp. Leaf126 TaxID=1736266 RepID=UPI0006FD557A|nr:putative quinol monooxygenase [Duganella sp. Leaf126]KQQ33403.1 antibiotic biosynthesis monooxygenase [Duganella sp. Leaf126]